MGGSADARARARLGIRGHGVVAATRSGLVLAIATLLTASAAPADALWPEVRVLSPAEIAIDGSRSDWDGYPTPAPGDPPNYLLDRLAPLHLEGLASAGDGGRVYGRYDCEAQTLFVRVHVDQAALDTTPAGAASDLVAIGSETVVNGVAGIDPDLPQFAFVDTTGWEAAISLPPGSYEGVDVKTRLASSGAPRILAVLDRSITLNIRCSDSAAASSAGKADSGSDLPGGALSGVPGDQSTSGDAAYSPSSSGLPLGLFGLLAAIGA